MLNDGFQYIEQRDSDDNVTHAGVVSKTSPFATADNRGILDVIAEDLRALYDDMSSLSLAAMKKDIEEIFDKMKNDPTFASTTATEQAKLALQYAERAEKALSSTQDEKKTIDESIAQIEKSKQSIDAVQGIINSLTEKANTLSASIDKANAAAEATKTSETNAAASATAAKESADNAAASVESVKTATDTAKADLQKAVDDTKASVATSQAAAQKAYDDATALSKSSATDIQTAVDNAKTDVQKTADDTKASAKKLVDDATASVQTLIGTAKSWAESDTSPDGTDGAKSSKSWAKDAEASAAKSVEIEAKVQGVIDKATETLRNSVDESIVERASKAARESVAEEAEKAANEAVDKAEDKLDAKYVIKADVLATDGKSWNINAQKDGDGNVISATYLKSADANFLGLHGKADAAIAADKATSDADGNVIAKTYLKSTDADTTYVKKTDVSDKASKDSDGNEITKTYLQITDADTTYAKKTDIPDKALKDADGNEITKTYLKITDADTTYAKKADIPDKAVKDADGNVITETYLKKADANFLGLHAKADSAIVADSATSVDWTALKNAPATYPPAEHNHDALYVKTTDVATDTNAYGKIPKVDTLGVVNVGKAIDFHSSTDDTTGTRIEFDGTNLVFSVPIKGSFAGGVEKATTADTATRATTADSATKATQDSAGQQIDATYIKSITATNGTATVTYGDGHTATFAVGRSAAEIQNIVNIPTKDVGGNIWIEV